MAKRSGTHYVISGNFLVTGAPAYLTPAGEWSGDLQQAATLLAEAERDAWLERALGQESVICDAYVIEVKLDPEAAARAIDPLTTRERIRAAGPSVRGRRPDPHAA